jgi:hypothetical protein
MSAAQEGDCPEFEVPSSLPELSPYTEGHTVGSYSRTYSGEEEYESESGEEEESEEEEGEAEEGEEESAPETGGSPPPTGGGIAPG